MLENILVVVAGVVGLIIFIALIRSGHFMRSLLFSAVTGNAALLSISYLGAFTGVTLSANLFTTAAATILGIPGVLCLLLLKLIFA